MLLLSACQAAPQARLETARNTAALSHMRERDIAANPFLIRAYERIDKPSLGTARIYIEGDGLAWLGRSRPSPDPTPIDPVALSLAQADASPNVIYLARPCQFNGMLDGSACRDDFWKAARFAPTIIDAMNFVLDEIKRRYALRKMELIGFSGGGAIAILLAARRSDVVNIRTVAGTLDIERFSQIHNVSPLSRSLNPARAAKRVAAIPQLHFTGQRDDIIPHVIYESFRHAGGSSSCIQNVEVSDAAHETGWVTRWPQLLAMAPGCLPR